MYPTLAKLVLELARENYGIQHRCWLLPRAEWVWPEQAAALEEAAASFSVEDLYRIQYGTYGEGGDEDHGRLGPKAEAVDAFINDVFDGDLHPNFFRDRPLPFKE